MQALIRNEFGLKIPVYSEMEVLWWVFLPSIWGAVTLRRQKAVACAEARRIQHKCQQRDNHVQRQKVYIIISLTSMANRISESTADDSHGWIFAEVVYD